MMFSAADSHSGLLFRHAELPQRPRRKHAREPTPLVPLLEIVSAAVASPLGAPARPRLAIAADSSTASGLIDMRAIRASSSVGLEPLSAAAFVAHRLVATTPTRPAPEPKGARARSMLVAAIMVLSALVGALGYAALTIASAAFRA